jgi:hypothetical protein
VNPFDRLRALQADNNEKGLEMMQEAGRFSRLASRHEDGTAPRAVSSFNLFQTPEEVAARMAGMIPADALTIREPSAGLGRLYLAARQALPAAHIELIEESAECAAELYRMTEADTRATLKQADFLSREWSEVDAVLMNPPFKMGRDIKHIMHALKFLNPGGMLISLCYDGSRQNKKLRPLCYSWEVLPAGTFKSEGTGASVALLTIIKEA